MKLIKTITLLLLIIITTSCFDYIEVNELAIVEGISIDYIDNNYDLIIETVDLNDEKENSYLLKSNSSSIDEAFNNIEKQSSKKLSMSHLETLIISKNILFNHIDDLADYFINNKNITTNFYLVYSDDPKGILTNKNDDFKINSKSITDNLDKNKNNKYRFDFIYASIKNNKIFEMPKVSIENNNIKIDKESLLYEE